MLKEGRYKGNWYLTLITQAVNCNEVSTHCNEVNTLITIQELMSVG